MTGDLAGKRVLVLGLGREGRASIRYLRASVPSLHIAAADRLDGLDADTSAFLREHDIDSVHLGADYLDAVAGYEVIVRAPGIPPWLPTLERAVASGARLTSNTHLFFAAAPGRVIGVTGTKGKSTTTSLIHHVLAAALPDVRLCGNFGFAPSVFLPDATPQTLFVMELSCHQLSDLDVSPDVAVVQDVVPEHLDYYRSFVEYVRAKQNIVLHQRPDDTVVYNAGAAIPRALARSSQARRLAFSLDDFGNDAAFVRDETIWVALPGTAPEPVLPVANVPVLGRFNLRPYGRQSRASGRCVTVSSSWAKRTACATTTTASPRSRRRRRARYGPSLPAASSSSPAASTGDRTTATSPALSSMPAYGRCCCCRARASASGRRSSTPPAPM